MGLSGRHRASLRQGFLASRALVLMVLAAAICSQGAQTGCVSDALGRNLASGKCCAGETVSIQGSMCTRCEQSVCAACAATTYRDAAGNCMDCRLVSKCSKFRNGNHEESSMTTAEALCPVGSTQAPRCTECMPGYRLVSISSGPSLCGPCSLIPRCASYVDGRGQPVTLPESTRQLCPAGSAQRPLCTACAAGSLLDARENQCLEGQCPPGCAACSDAATCTACAEGHWAKVARGGAFSCEACAPGVRSCGGSDGATKGQAMGPVTACLDGWVLVRKHA